MGDDWEDDDFHTVSSQPSGLTAVVRMYYDYVFLSLFSHYRSKTIYTSCREKKQQIVIALCSLNQTVCL